MNKYQSVCIDETNIINPKPRQPKLNNIVARQTAWMYEAVAPLQRYASRARVPRARVPLLTVGRPENPVQPVQPGERMMSLPPAQVVHPMLKRSWDGLEAWNLPRCHVGVMISKLSCILMEASGTTPPEAAQGRCRGSAKPACPDAMPCWPCLPVCGLPPFAALCFSVFPGFHTTTNFSIFFSFWFWRRENLLEIALLKVPTFWDIIYPPKP